MIWVPCGFGALYFGFWVVLGFVCGFWFVDCVFECWMFDCWVGLDSFAFSLTGWGLG